MKPLHVGLLVFGAAVAGGLAVRMTQEPAVVAPVVARPVPAAKPVVAAEPVIVAKPAPVPAPAQVKPVETAAPPPVYSEALKPAAPAKWRPSPFPVVAKVENRAEPVKVAPKPPMTIAPAPYSEPPHAPPKQVAAAVPAAAPAPEVKAVKTAAPRHQAVLPEGTPVAIRLKQTLTTEHSAGGDTFEAVLTQPLIADGFVIAEPGARVTGHVVNARKAGRVSDVSRIELALSTVQTADGQRVSVITEPWSRPDDLPVETVIQFRLASRVTVTERPL